MKMFEGWPHADPIAVMALGVSAAALVVSALAARYSAIQAGVATRREREDARAKEPAIDPMLSATSWPGWYRLKIGIRNRIDTPIVCGPLRVRGPRGAKLILSQDVGEVDGANILLDDVPSEERLRSELNLDLKIPRAGARKRFHNIDVPNDVAHVDALVLISSSKELRSPKVLEMSLVLRPSNETASFAETAVKVTIPADRAGA